jgi:hypothetical protein
MRTPDGAAPQLAMERCWSWRQKHKMMGACIV